MGKNGKLGKAARVVPPKAKPSNKNQTKDRENPSTIPESTIPKELQQRCLDIFRDALWTGPEDIAAVQEVKGHLYNREFARAFASEQYLRAYALRWSAARALGYMQVFDDLHSFVLGTVATKTEVKSLQALCLGGGAGAELVALAGWLNACKSQEEVGTESGIIVRIELVDIAQWEHVVRALEDATVNPLVLSKYASAAAREANRSLVTRSIFEAKCQQADVLNWTESNVADKAGKADLITLMFTLNELYSTSVPKTQRLLTLLTATAVPGTLLLVVDSPGSYSTVSIGGAEKKYPMQWLLGHTLLSTKDAAGGKGSWQKIVSEDSKWFRLPEGLKYPIDLENMRYQIHLYKRCERFEEG